MLGRRRFDDDAIDMDDASDDSPRMPLGYAVGIFLFPLHVLHIVFGTVWTFLWQWVTTRPLSLLLQGLPFVLVFLAVVLLLQASGRVSRSDLVTRYRAAAAKASGDGERKAAALWLEKAIQLNPNDPVYLCSQALLADEDGQRDKARQIMRRIAPTDGKGYPMAHFWLAQDLIGQSLPLTPELSRTIEHHLGQSLRSEPLAAESHALLGQLMVIRGDRPQAIFHFERAVREKPECHLSLAVLHGEQNEPDKANRSARRAADYYAKRAAAEPETWEHRLHWAQSELLAENHAQAVDILEQALSEVEDPQPVRELLVAACLAWLGDLTQREPNRLDRQLDILNIAFRHGPDHPEVLALIANLVTQERDGTDSQQVAQFRDGLNLALATGSAPPLVHLIVGTRALEAGNVESAVMHLELAYKANADAPLVLNSLAWGLAHRDSPEFR